MSRRYNPGTLRFMVAAIIFMVVLEVFILPEKEPYRGEPQPAAVTAPEPLPLAKTEPELILPGPEKLPAVPEEPPAWRKFAVPADAPPDKPKIAIIIDDLGEDRVRTRGIITLPGPLTLAYLPYPKDIQSIVEEGRTAGHEIMMHMPMESVDISQDTGPYVLRPGMDPAAFENVLRTNLDSFTGYVGINNHMGSRLTQDPEAMRVVMAHLRDRGLLFVDSRTIGSSVAEQTAADFLLPHAARDVFLDNDPTLESVNAALAQTEQAARRNGRAIAIGHPKDATIEALRAWLPALAEKGFVLVPVSAVVTVEAPATTPSSSAPAPDPQPAPPPQ